MVADTTVLAVPDPTAKTVIETRLHDVFVLHLGRVHHRLAVSDSRRAPLVDQFYGVREPEPAIPLFCA